jgi:RimJ/RimL family protein N-acetyltransferase
MKLTTRRLVLRQPTRKDVKSLIRNINNLNVSRWLLVVPYPYTKKDALWWVNHCAEKAGEKPRTSYEFNIQLRDEEGIVGGVGVTKINRAQKTGVVGYWLGEDYWRQGIMSEAFERVLDFAFSRLKLRRLEGEVFTGNKASAGLLKKFGFQYEGTRRQACVCKANGEIHDAEIYGLLVREYRSRHERK